jgi:hypothetical protein
MSIRLSALHRAALVTLGLASCLACSAGYAADPPSRPGPPPEAIAACEKLAVGNACSFKAGERGAMNGSCWAPEGRPLACRPAGAPRPRQAPAR